MKNTLILITREFPFGRNETFLESEIVILSKHFDNIIVFPSIKSKSCRTIPENVKLDLTIADLYNRKSCLVLKSILTTYFFNTIFSYYFQIKSFRKLINLLKYIVSYNIYKHAAKLILAKNPTIIYSYWLSPAVDALVDVRLKYNYKSKIVSRAHRGDLYEEFSSLGFFPHRATKIHRIDTIYSISFDGLLYLKQKYNFLNTKLSRLGVFEKSYISKSSNPGHISIVSVSNVIPVKRVDLIARSILQVALNYPDINIQWNHFGDGNEMGKVISLLNNSSYKNFDYKFHGRIPNIEIYNFYSNNIVDCLINLSISEGIPVSMMEAISFGIPLIGTNVGGVSEIINDTTGILLPPNPSLGEVEKAILKINSFKKEKYSIKRFWADNYSADNNYTKFAIELIN
ncbi:glycosyltransferase [Telluribacter humicola]|uniref:glycosyltransferase n=1 Tax=Telluribacter humicola TaxID=1720261 RepID=UPI001A975B14|nr:glycosyltransferase [Telluribacter humicola]